MTVPSALRYTLGATMRPLRWASRCLPSDLAPSKLRGLCQKHGGGSMCSVEGCTRGAKVRNLCGEHGGSKRCTVPNCGKLDRGRGFCQKHGDLFGLGAPQCAAPLCDRKAVSKTKQLCAQHGGGRRCVASGCQKIAKTQFATCLQHADAAAAAAAVEAPGAEA